MNTRLLATFGASTLALAAAAAGIASASDRSAAADARIAAGDAAKAGKALARHDVPAALAAAEHAVELAPRDADHRVLLGQSYLAAGRFVSARGAFADALTLAPTNAKAALNLVLAQIATGDWAAARRTLDEHGAVIAAPDRGLALALAGDPTGAVQLLTQVARSPETSAKVRQNLALSLALAGEWPASRAVAAVDLSPTDLDKRMEQWAAFAHPHAAADQVATLLGVTPVADGGQPAQLALAGEPSVAVAAVAAPVMPVASAPMSPPVEVAAASSAAQPGFVATRVAFGPRMEVVQPLPMPASIASTAKRPLRPVAPGTVAAAHLLDPNAPAPVARMLNAEATPMKVALAAPAAAAGHGTWFVQLGAFQSAAVAHDAWGRATRRMPALASRTASGVNFTANKTSFYRLSVGGFTRGQADALCGRYRAVGGACFVRAGAGDQVVAWAHRNVQVASR